MERQNERLDFNIEDPVIGEEAQTPQAVLDNPVAIDGSKTLQEIHNEGLDIIKADRGKGVQTPQVFDNPVARGKPFFQVGEPSTVPGNGETSGGKIQVVTESSSPNLTTWYNKVIAASSSPVYVYVWRNNILKKLNFSNIVDPEIMIPEFGTCRIINEAEHKLQHRLIGNELFMSTPMVLMGAGWKEVLYMKAGLEKENKVVLDNRVAIDGKSKKMDQVVTESSSPNLTTWYNKVNLYKRVFNACDENGDGKISLAELKQCMEMLGEKLSLGFARLAINSDGLVEFDEFVWLVKAQKLQASQGTNVHRLPFKELANTLPEQKDFSWEAFRSYVTHDTTEKKQTVYVLLFLGAGILCYPISATNNTTTNPFDFRVGETTNTPQLPLTFGEAIFAYSPQIHQITRLMVCYFVTSMLVLFPIEPLLQIFFIVLLVCTPLFYILQLAPKASSAGVVVACGGSLKLPLIGFATLVAAGISLICMVMTIVIVYFVWRVIYKGKTRVMEGKISSNDLSKALELSNAQEE